MKSLRKNETIKDCEMKDFPRREQQNVVACTMRAKFEIGDIIDGLAK